MTGATVGDIAGSLYEFHNIKTRDFALFADYHGRRARPTDDSVMTLAVMQSLLDAADDLPALPAAAVRRMQECGRRYPYAGYGGSFRRWLASSDPKPYNRWGNGTLARLDEFQRGTVKGFEERFS